MKERLVALLIEKKISIASCESLTAGLFTSTLACVPGVSQVLKGGIVSYQNCVKENVVKVSHEMIEQQGVISIACAIEMAEKTRVLLDSDVCVSFTGNAGPDVMEDKPAGYVCCAIALANKTYTYELYLQGDRNAVREQAVMNMMKHLIEVIENL